MPSRDLLERALASRKDVHDRHGSHAVMSSKTELCFLPFEKSPVPSHRYSLLFCGQEHRFRSMLLNNVVRADVPGEGSDQRLLHFWDCGTQGWQHTGVAI